MILLDTLLAELEIGVEPFALCEIRTRWRLRPVGRGEASVHYVLAGQGVLALPDGAPLAIKAGAMVVIPSGVKPWIEPDGAGPAGTVRITACEKPRQDWRRLRAGSGRFGVILACGAIHATYHQSTGLFNYLAEPIVEDFSTSSEIRRTFRRLLKEMADPKPGSRSVVECLLRECLVMLLRRYCASGHCRLPWLSALEDPKLGRAVAAMLERPEAHHTLESLGGVAGMSRSAFAQAFRTAFGRPAMVFLREIRLRRAACRLASTELSVKAVAGAVGIASRSYFWRAFKALYGIEPAAYRAACRRSSRRGLPSLAKLLL